MILGRWNVSELVLGALDVLQKSRVVVAVPSGVLREMQKWWVDEEDIILGLAKVKLQSFELRTHRAQGIRD